MNDDKQALIKRCETAIGHLSQMVAAGIHGKRYGVTEYGYQLMIYHIALADLKAEPVAWRHDGGPFGPVATCHKNAAENWLANGFNLKELFQTPPAPLPAIPDGWKLVPVELTQEMRNAWDGAPNCNTEDDDENMRRAYHSMMAAAPSPVS